MMKMSWNNIVVFVVCNLFIVAVKKRDGNENHWMPTAISNCSEKKTISFDSLVQENWIYCSKLLSATVYKWSELSIV